MQMMWLKLHIAKIIVPKGTTIYEGMVAPQNIYDSLGNVIGTLPGGRNQIYIPKVEARWFEWNIVIAMKE